MSDSILVEGRYRSFHYNNPGNSKRSSLMFVMHGSGGNGKDMMISTIKLEEKSKDEKLLLVYPSGYQRIGMNAAKLQLQQLILRI